MNQTKRSLKSFSSLTLANLIVLAGALFCSTLTVVAQNAAPPSDGWVVLPVDEYRALRRAAFPLDREPVPPPVEATLSRIDYQLKVEGDLASGEARLTVDVLKDGWVRLALPEGLMVREAQLDGHQVTLVNSPQGKSGTADLLLSRIGRSVVLLKIVAPVSTVAGTDILKLPVSNSAISHAVVELTRQGIDVHINGGLLLDHQEFPDGSRWTANGRGTEPLTFAWRRRVDDQRANQPLKFRGTVTQLVGLGEDSTQISAEIRVDVLQGLASEIHLLLPEQFNVNQVSGAMVADWDAKARELKVLMIEPIQDTGRFTVTGELRLPRAGKLEVPLLRLPEAEREAGGIAVEVLGAGEIKNRVASGLEDAEASELGQLISTRQSPSLLAFRFQPGEGRAPRSLTLEVARYTPQAVLTANVEAAEYNALMAQDGKLLVQTRFAVRNNQRNFLKVNLPANAVLWSAAVAGRPVRPGSASDGSLLLPLEKNRTGDETPTFIVEISYLDRRPAWTDKGRFSLTLLAIDLPISKSHLLVHYSPRFKLTTTPGVNTNFRLAPYEPSQASFLLGGAAAATAVTATGLSSAEGVSEDTQKLVQGMKEDKRSYGPTRNLPLRVAFPHFGPAVFLVSELTSENQTPIAEFDFQLDRKRGAK
jgi:hypothetical protein